MSTDGISLVGFLDQPSALNYLKNLCVPPVGHDDAAIVADWHMAVAAKGAPTANAGHPQILPIPASEQPYIDIITSSAWFQQAFAGQSVRFALIEADKLLAFQFHIDVDRQNHHLASTAVIPTMQELLRIFLPQTPASEKFTWRQQANSLVIRSKSLNLGTRLGGLIDVSQGLAGIVFNVSLPLVHVTHFNGRYYLHNGFHRTYGARMKGATHVPCLIRDVADADAAGIRNDGGTFAQALMESADPPTLEHYTQGRAWRVKLRDVSRIIHLSWSEYALFEE